MKIAQATNNKKYLEPITAALAWVPHLKFPNVWRRLATLLEERAKNLLA